VVIAEQNGKYVVYDASGRVIIIITTNKRIAEHYANNS